MDVVREAGFCSAILGISDMSHYDVMVVGGGITGCAFALALAQQTSFSIAILEEKPAVNTWDAENYHHRVSAIALSSQRLFASLKIWDDMQQKRVSPFKKISVWDAESSGQIHFDSADIGEDFLGFVMENNVMEEALHEQIRHYPQIQFIAPVSLVSVTTHEQCIELVAADGTIFAAKLAVAADGANSWLRQQVGIAVNREAYDQKAIVTTVRTEQTHAQIARQVFLDSGPLAFLPLQDACFSSIVWSLPSQAAMDLCNEPVDLFKTKLNQAFANRLGEVLEIGERYAFPLYKQSAKQYVMPRIALMGDAAHVVHPLAGQGLNMGLLDAMSLAEVISDAAKSQRDAFSYAVLRRYERWRKADNFALTNGIDMIKRLFASNKAGVMQWRSLGLRASNNLRWIKNMFTRHAVGRRGGLPRIVV